MTANQPRGGPGHEEGTAQQHGARGDPAPVHRGNRRRDEHPVRAGRARRALPDPAGPGAGATGPPAPWPHERRSEADPGGWRNGYEDARLKTAEGEVAVRVPQVRGADGPYRSKLMEFLGGHSGVLDRLVTAMYARGVSTRDGGEAFQDAPGT